MDETSSGPAFISSVFYQEPKAALAWLEQAFGFRTTMVIDGPDGDDSRMHRTYRVRDPEGHVWTFFQAVERMSIAEMERAGGVKIKPGL